MLNEAKAAGQYRHETMGRNYDRIGIVTVQEILDGARLEIPMSLEVLKAAQKAGEVPQDDLPFDALQCKDIFQSSPLPTSLLHDLPSDVAHGLDARFYRPHYQRLRAVWLPMNARQPCIVIECELQSRSEERR